MSLSFVHVLKKIWAGAFGCEAQGPARCFLECHPSPPRGLLCLLRSSAHLMESGPHSSASCSVIASWVPSLASPLSPTPGWGFDIKKWFCAFPKQAREQSQGEVWEAEAGWSGAGHVPGGQTLQGPFSRGLYRLLVPFPSCGLPRAPRWARPGLPLLTASLGQSRLRDQSSRASHGKLCPIPGADF